MKLPIAKQPKLPKVIEPTLLAKMSPDFVTVETKLYSYAISKLFVKGVAESIDNIDSAAIFSNSTIEIPLSEYQVFMGKSRDEAYDDIARISDSMLHKYFKLNPEELPEYIDLGLKIKRGKVLFHAIRLIAYDADTGNILIRFTPELIYLYSRLGGGGVGYFTYEIENIRKLRTNYSIQLFRYLSSILFRGTTVKILVEDNGKSDSIDMLLGIATKYPKYADKKRYVIEPALNEINEKTVLAVGFKEIKEGRRVKWIEFEVMRKDGGPKAVKTWPKGTRSGP